MTSIASPDVTPQEVATETLRLGDRLDQIGSKLDEHIATQSDDLSKVDAKMDRFWDELQKRVPIWVTAVISVLGTMFGAASGIAFYANAQVVALHALIGAISK